MTESEAYLQLALILGIVFCIPFFWVVVRELTKFIIYKFFPPKFITIKIKKLNGDIERREVEIDDAEALVNALLEGETT